MEFLERLKLSLETSQKWPGPYSFKFIVPVESQQDLLMLLPIGQIEQRESRNGRYISVSLTTLMTDASKVIETYQKVAGVPGLISL